MKVIISDKDLKPICKGLTKEEAERFEKEFRWHSEDSNLKVDIEKLCDASLEFLHSYLSEKGAKDNRSAKMAATQVKQWMELKKDPDGQIVTKLENLDSTLDEYIKKAEHRYLFEQRADGNMVPWFVSKISYAPYTENHPSSVSVALKGINTGSSGRRESDSRSIYLLSEDVRKKTVSQILQRKGFYLETPERMESYHVELKRYLELSEQDGYQMNVSGKCYLKDGWYNSEFRSVEKAGKPAKMVIDPDGKEQATNSTECSYWKDKPEDHLFELPVHPILRMFDLDEHSHYLAHVNNTVPYEYNTKIGEKLVLPEDVKDFIETLVEHSANKFQDIVGGKEGGTIILLEGPPGTGKTLSAEVYSEVMQRPLYKIQSSQLGIDPKSLEEELKEVLQRSERWGAILLIDEADVYIRARGGDIRQNAIVGVFLRVLEYYRGVLFMTTNRGTDVDDAIVSRMTARFRYQNPTEDEQFRLWQILSEQNGRKIDDADIRAIIAQNNTMSGRDIKNVMKLAYVLSLRRKCKITAELVKYVSKFKQA